jgi:FAD:protein FMN transferase
MKTIIFNAMGSRIFIALDTDDEAVIAEGSKIQPLFEEWEQSLSRFRISSELSELNRHPGVPKKMSRVFSEVMRAAEHAVEISDGLVTPTILNALINVGYKNDFDQLLEQNGKDFEHALLSPVEPEAIEIDWGTNTIILPFGVQLDFGGVAKGWAAQTAMQLLRKFAPVLVDAGGDIAISGKMRDGSNWPIGVSNPFDADNNLALLMFAGGGVATSGKDYHRWIFDGEMQHHIIDPRNMLPAQTDILTATVFASNLLDAEAFAKTALILGSDAGQQFLETKPGVGYLFVLENGTLIRNDIFVKTEWNPQCQTS